MNCIFYKLTLSFLRHSVRTKTAQDAAQLKVTDAPVRVCYCFGPRVHGVQNQIDRRVELVCSPVAAAGALG